MIYTVINKTFRNSKSSGQMTDATINTPDCDKVVVSLISALLNSGCPSAIFRSVVSRIVNSIYAHSRWSFSHVFEKVREHFPSIAHSYSPSSVSRKVGPILGRTPHQHVSPSDISVGSFNTTTSTMNQKSVVVRFLFKTTTRTRIPANHGGIPHVNKTTTITPTKANSCYLSSWESYWLGLLKNFELSKLLSYDRYSSRHNDIPLCLAASDRRHSDTRLDCFLPRFPRLVNCNSM